MEQYGSKDALKAIPPVNDILEHQAVAALVERFGRHAVTGSIRLVLDEYRRNIDTIQFNARPEVEAYMIKRLEERLEDQQKSSLRKVINATGIVLHTNLGRAPLPQKAIRSMVDVCEGYSSLEFDLETGSRGSRHSHVEPFITRIAGAESAMIVNNNAAAVFLCLNTLAANREVIVSRGQQVEIGGSFRIPDIIARSGAKMAEVGTTNKTRLSDYSSVVTGETSVLLKVHTSNFKVTGFTEEVSLEDLVGLGREKDLIVMEDLGSGSLYDLSLIGLPYEPTVQDSIKAGADIVTFSGDKLLGGPQAGIIAGKKALIDRIKRNPLARMVRCDRTTIAAMTAVLSLYFDDEKVVNNIPALRMMALKEDELSAGAIELEKLINTALGSRYNTEIVEDEDEIGGGSLPGVVLKGKSVALAAPGLSADELRHRLRKAKIPVVCRINKDRVLLNVRTLEKEDYQLIVESLDRILE